MKRFLSPTIKPLLVFLMAILSGVQSVQAQTKEAYAYSPTSDRTTFYFYYDTSRATRNTTGVTFNLNTGANTPEWYNYHPAGAMAYLQELVKTVVFDTSFRDYRPTSTASWFRMPYLETIENFYNLYTQNVTCMNYMFNGCQRLATLDFRNLSGSTTNMTDNYCFNTENVTSMRGMFGYCRALTSLDLSGWNTSNVTDMAGMFEACYNLQTLTLGKGSAGSSSSLVERKGWNTSKVTDMDVMFGTCTNLTTINVGANWSTVMVNTSCKPFTGSTKLVGGAGTTYSDSYNSPTYARIDGGTSTTRGLLTATYGPYVHVNSAGTMVTFYYDELRSLRSGTTYNLNTSSSSPGWYKSSDNNPYTRVVIDPSFAQARPTTCYGWFSGMKNVTTIEGLEYLNTSEVTNMKYMFSNCFSLTSLDLSHFNTSKVTDMYGMFEQCKALTELDLSQFSTSKVKNMQNMFISCQKLTTIYASSNFSVSNVSFSQNMFIYCYKLVGGAGTEYSISYVDKGYARIDGGTASPGYFSTRPYAVYNNGTLTFYDDGNPNGKTGTKYNLNSSGDPGWLTDNNYQNVTKVVFNSSFANARPKTTMYWFGLMTNLTSITGLEYLNTSEVTSMSNMFSHTKLASLDLSHFNTQKVVTMGSMFYNCKQLTSLDLSSFNTANVIEMSAMFSSCNNLQRIYVGDGWSTAKVGSHELMFQTCTSLVGGNGTAFNSSYTDKTYARIDGFNGLPGYLTRPAYAVLNDGTLTFYCDGQKSSRTGTIYDIPTATEEAPGWYGSSITHVVFSSSFAQARPTTGYAWFRGQTGLTDITGIQYLNTSEMTSMKYMFNRCSSLTSLNLHTFNTSKVTDMMLMFYKCSKLKTLNLEGWNTSNVTMMVSMFQDCSALTTIICEQTWKASTNSTYMFLGCGKLKGAVSYLDVRSDPLASTAAYANPTTGYFSLRPYAVHYPNTNSLYFYNDGRASYKTGTVYYLDALEDDYYPLWYINDGASVSHSVTNVNFDASFATARPTSTKGWFSEMTNITTINNIEWLNTENVENMEAMFEGCTGLTTLNLATFKTANVKNMNSMFQGCSNLTTVNVSANWTTDNVTTSTSMFTGCSAIVGGNGTTYSSHVDKEYARLDVEGTPGYFSGELPYLILSPDETTLTFYNDGLSAEKEGTRYNFTNAYGDTPSWRPKAGGVTKVVFDPSFATVRPEWVNSWFMNMTNLTTIEGMEYFNFSQTRRFNSLFSNCSSLTEIDLSHFTPGTGCAMGGMFYGCTNLMTIVVASDWTLNIVSNGDNMFSGCTSLVGGKGTTFDANNIGRTYARIDGGPSNPGYLTSGAREYYATWDDATFTITHYYDWRKSQRIAAGEVVIDGQGYDEMPSGNGDVYPGEIAKVVYDESCALSDGFYDTWSCVGMENLTAIEGLEHLGTSGNISLDYMFADCRSLTTLDLSSFDTRKETRTRNLFRGCTNLQNLTLGENFSTESVTDMSGMFSYNCNPSAIAAVISHEGFTTANVTNMKGMFQNCTSLTELDLSAFDTRNVTNMGEVHNTFSEGMFEGCSNLTTIIVGPDWSTAAVTTSAQMFRDCTALVGGEGTVFSTSHVDAAYAHIDRGADNPGYLTGKAYAPYVIYDDVSRVLTFYADNKEDEKDGTKYDLPAAQTTPGWNEGGQNMFVTKVVFDPSFITARPTSTWSWFMNMSNLTKIEGLENLVTSEVTDMTAMFGGCTGLTTLDLTSFNTAKVTNMSYMFNGCSALQTIYVGAGWTTTNVTSGAEMFNGCTSLVGSAGTVYDSSNRGIAYAHVDGGESNPGYLSGKTEGYAAYDSDTKTLTFYYDGQKLARSNVYDLNEGTNAPKWVANSSTSPLTNARRAVIDPSFADARPTSTCGWFNLYYLQEIEGMEYLNTSEVTVMNAMFARCAVSDLDLSHFDTRKVTSMYTMFWGAHGLTTLDLSSFDTKNVVDMRRMFAGIDGTHTNILTTIYVGSGWNTDAVVVSTNMFANSPNLVGGNGTAYDPEHVDKAYARLDGGTSSPGYLSDKNAFSIGDVNKDRKITIADVTALVNIILGKTTTYEQRLADVNNDQKVTIADVTALVNIILGKN